MATVENLVLEACAGSGKTHKLIERFLRLLREGAKPRDILAITFTKKAAAEIHTRLLRELRKESAHDNILRDCHRRILLAEEKEYALTIHTFHGWFLTLLENRPWSAAIWGVRQLESDAEMLFEEAWRRWLHPQTMPPALSSVMVFLSPLSLKKMLHLFINEINAWRLFCRHKTAVQRDRDAVVAEVEQRRQAAEESLKKSATMFCQNARGNGVAFVKAHQAAMAIADGTSNARAQAAAFLTQKMTIRSNLRTNADKCGYCPQLAEMTEMLKCVLQAEDDRQAWEFNFDALAVCESFMHEWEAVKEEKNVMTFDDLEYLAWDAVMGDLGALSHRLGGYYRHILIDEFQDTSPLQWQIIRHWLHDAHGGDGAPSVFLLGDIKQAIYGFRHGDARLLGRAADFLQTHYRARRQQENISRRCSTPVLALINETFRGWEGFIAHRPAPENAALAGRVEWATFGGDKTAAPTNPRPRIRNPLMEPRPDKETPRLHWAREVAAAADTVIRRQQIKDGNETRRVRAEDVLILLPRFTHAALLVDALSMRGIPCAATGRQLSLGGYFECADVLDLIRILLSPQRDLSLARVLKSPIFSLSDDMLNRIACDQDGECLWDKMQLLALPDAALARAQTLLTRWRRRVYQTPVPTYDLLAQIFAEGDIAARYRAAVRPSLRRRVSDNLSRLLDLSLAGGGGNRPLPAQFLQDIKRAAEMTGGGGLQGVRLMTVHAAKGLESPVVIVADADFSEHGDQGATAEILTDWAEDAAAVENFVLHRRRAPAFAALKARQQAAKLRERENLLYVALSRAKQMLLIFLPQNPAERTEDLARALQKLAPDHSFGDEMRINETEKAADAATVEKTAAENKPIGSYIARTRTMTLGEQKHLLLSLWLEGFDEKDIRRLAAPLREELLAETRIIAQTPQIQTLLGDCAQFWVEADIAHDGKILRPDLLIIQDRCAWIVDYKSGGADPARYRRQLANYRDAVRALYPQLPVQAGILALDKDTGEGKFTPYNLD